MLHKDTAHNRSLSFHPQIWCLCMASNLGENMVDIRVHKALFVSVLGHPQDLGGNGRERWDSDVHVVPGGHWEQWGDLGVHAVENFSLRPWLHSRVTLRTDDALTFVSCWRLSSGSMCGISDVKLTFVWSPRSLSGVFSEWGACPFFSHPAFSSLTWLKKTKTNNS